MEMQYLKQLGIYVGEMCRKKAMTLAGALPYPIAPKFLI